MVFRSRDSPATHAVIDLSDSTQLSGLPGVIALACGRGVWNLLEMDEPVIAIHGRGLLPGLLAMQLRAQTPHLPLLVLSPDRTLCGEQLEPVIASKLSAAALHLVDPFAVSRWSGYYVVRGGSHELHEDTVLLLDPVLVWLELQAQLPPPALVARCGPINQQGSRITWTGGSAALDRLIDLAPLLGPGEVSQIVGADAVRGLALPVLADYDMACARWSAHQYLPLGDERLVIRKLPQAADLIAQQSSFEALLNALTLD